MNVEATPLTCVLIFMLMVAVLVYPVWRAHIKIENQTDEGVDDP